MRHLSKLAPLLIVFILLAACGGNQTPEPYIFKFEETDSPTTQPDLRRECSIAYQYNSPGRTCICT